MSRKILLADDSVTIQKVIELTFMDEDYEVKAVSNGDEALAALPALSPDFVIADVHMPGANGYEVCRRSKELHPAVPVLLLVGTFEPFDEGQARAAGADSFLKKPFDSQELLQRVQDLLGGAGAGAAGAPPPSHAPSPPLDLPAGLPPLDLGPAPFQQATAEPDWGAFQLEPEPHPPSAPAFAAPEPPPARPSSPFLDEETPFVLEDDHSAAYEVEATALPAGEPLFELDPHVAPLAPLEPAAAAPFHDAAAPALGSIDFEPLPSPTQRPAAGFGAPWMAEAPAAASAPPVEPPAPPAAAPPVPAVSGPRAAIVPPEQPTESLWSPAIERPVLPTPPMPAMPPIPPMPPMAPTPPAAAPAARTTGAVPLPVNGGGRLSDEDVERIARRVVELIGDKPVRDVVWEVVPDLAEVVIRDRLRELESQVENPAE